MKLILSTSNKLIEMNIEPGDEPKRLPDFEIKNGESLEISTYYPDWDIKCIKLNDILSMSFDKIDKFHHLHSVMFLGSSAENIKNGNSIFLDLYKNLRMAISNANILFAAVNSRPAIKYKNEKYKNLEEIDYDYFDDLK